MSPDKPFYRLDSWLEVLQWMLKYSDNFKQQILRSNQGKQKNATQGTLSFLRVYFGWSIETSD
jgi:hypothetical protein